MANKPLLSPEALRQLVRADPELGKIYWLERPADTFAVRKNSARHSAATWNTRYSGKEALTAKNRNGYLHGCINSKFYLAHRVIWALYHSKWPSIFIDHINGIKSDNRISNLREANYSQNAANRCAVNVTSGYLGVSRNSEKKLWQAFIGVGGNSRFLGYYPCEITAAKVYDAAASQAYGEFARLNFPP